MPEITLLFTRRERLDVTRVAILTLSTDRADLADPVAALERATTRWVETSESGRQCWEMSCQDLNIGDLANDDAFPDPAFAAELAREGLTFVRLECADGESSLDYDHVLASPAEKDEDDEDEAADEPAAA